MSEEEKGLPRIENLQTIDVENLFARLDGVSAGLIETATENILGFGKQHERVLNQLLTFLRVVHTSHADETNLNSLERGIDVRPFSIEIVKADIIALQQLIIDADLPKNERDVALEQWNELLTALSSIVRSFELYKRVGVLDKVLWIFNGGFLRDKVAEYRTQHKVAMSYYGGLKEFLSAVEKLDHNAVDRVEQIRKLRQKVAQGAWEELCQSLVEEAQMKAMDFKTERAIVDSRETEVSEIQQSITSNLWDQQEQMQQTALYVEILGALETKVKGRGFSDELINEFKFVWAMADGDEATLDSQSAITILQWTEHLLSALREERFVRILYRHLYKNKKSVVEAV